jgi:ubiquinone/menaquinone biosynthesis C-methylase UbiE
MKKLTLPTKKLPEVGASLRRRMRQLLPSEVDEPNEEAAAPFDKYYRKKLLQQINLREVSGYSVLEVGCGVGDLLLLAASYRPREIFGVEEDDEALNNAKLLLHATGADLSQASILQLPFPDKSFDYVYALFELQYLADELLESAVSELCRVCRQFMIIVEETSVEKSEENGIIRRPIEHYNKIFRKQKFHLITTRYLDIAFSRSLFKSRRNIWIWIRWVFSPLLYLMGFPASWMKFPSAEETPETPVSKFALFVQRLVLPISSSLDDVFKINKGVAIMRFEREKLFRRG